VKHSVGPTRLNGHAPAPSPDYIAAALDHQLAVLNQAPQSIDDNPNVFVDLRLIVCFGNPYELASSPMTEPTEPQSALSFRSWPFDKLVSSIMR